MTPSHHPSMGNQGPLSQPHTPLHRLGMSPACSQNAPQDPASAPLRLTAAPAIQVIPRPLVWGFDDSRPVLGVREEPCLALQHRSFPFSQKSAISGAAHMRTEPGSAWMGTTAPPVSARWVLDVPRDEDPQSWEFPRDEDPQGYSSASQHLLGSSQLCSGLMVGTAGDPFPCSQGGEVECSFTPCPMLDCPQHQRHLGPGQCCSTCRDPPAPAGESG